jgi:hypothetical protein
LKRCAKTEKRYSSRIYSTLDQLTRGKIPLEIKRFVMLSRKTNARGVRLSTAIFSNRQKQFLNWIYFLETLLLVAQACPEVHT